MPGGKIDTGRDIAQICANGHLINGWSQQGANSNRDFCPKCGAATLTRCPDCDGEFPGGHVNRVSMYTPPVPAYCVHCGNPLPWTASVIEQTEQLYDLLDGLTLQERADLKQCFPDLIRDVPASPVAAIRTGKLLSRVEPHFREAFKQIAYSMIASKTQEILKGFGVS